MTNVVDLQFSALDFFSQRRGDFRKYSIIYEGSFALEWRGNNGDIGWLDAKGQGSKYRVEGNPHFVEDLLSHLGIPRYQVIYMRSKT